MMEDPVRILQEIVRFDTTNPPGNELACVEHLAGILRRSGYEPIVISAGPGRGNVVARHRGTGELPPLLLYGHVDVVPAEPAAWDRVPFSGELADGCIWGRGALDMKGLVTQQLAVMLRLQELGIRCRRDIIFAATADEESGGLAGMGYLVAHHPELIRAEYALSEGGGTTYYVAGRPFYDVRMAEKGTCRFSVRARGMPGHGSIPRADSAIARIAAAVLALHANPLPFRATPVAARWFETVAATLGFSSGARVLTERTIKQAAQRLPAEMGPYLHAITHDTAVPTGVQAGQRINVVPGEAEALFDGRILPGGSAEQFLAEVRRRIGPGYEIDVLDANPPIEEPAAGPLYQAIVSVMRRTTPEARIVPAMLTGSTDAKHVRRLGTSCLGFGPLLIPAGFPAERLVHGHNERIPVEGFLWGVQVLYDIVRELAE